MCEFILRSKREESNVYPKPPGLNEEHILAHELSLSAPLLTIHAYWTHKPMQFRYYQFEDA